MTTPKQIINQIGPGDMWAISEGDYRVANETTVTMPVSLYYSVEVEYFPTADLYEVRRITTKDGERTVEGVMTGILPSEVGETAYRASCYQHDFPYI